MEDNKSFAESGLHSYLVKCYARLGYHHPTPIQFYSMTTFKQNHCDSIMAQSKSGTGKTLSYLSILLSHCLENPSTTQKCSYLIILPTRELSLQVYQNLKEIVNICQNIKAETE